LKRDDTFANLERLAAFWKSIASQDDAVFSEKVGRGQPDG